MPESAINLGVIFSQAELRLGDWNRSFTTIVRDAAAFKKLNLAATPTLDAGKFGTSMNALKASTTATLTQIKTQFATHNAQTLAAAQSHAKAISRAAEDEKVGVLRAARSRIAEEKSLTTSGKLAIIHEAQDRARQISRAAADEKAAVLLQARETTAGLKTQADQRVKIAKEAAEKQRQESERRQQQTEQRRDARGQITHTAANVGMSMGATTAATAAWAANEAAKFENTLVIAQNNTDMTRRGAAIMRATAARNLTQYGVPVEQTARAFRIAGDYGFTDEKATTIVDAAIKSSVGTGGDVGEMSALLAGTMKSFNIPLNQASKLASKIHQAAIRGRMTPGELVGAAGPSLGLAGGLGLKSPEDVLAMFSALTQGQLTPEEANTQVRNIIVGITKPNPLQQKRINALTKLTGIPLDKDFTQAGLQQKGLMNIIDDVRRATAGGNESDIFDIFNAKKGGGLGAILLANKMAPMSQLRRDFRDIDAGKSDPTAAGFERQQATMDAAMKRLGGEFTMIGVKIGTDLLPYLKGFTNWLDGILKWFQNLPAGMRKTIEVAGGGAGAAAGTAGALTAGYLQIKGGQALWKQAFGKATGAGAAEEAAAVAGNAGRAAGLLRGAGGFFAGGGSGLIPHIEAPGGYLDTSIDLTKRVANWLGFGPSASPAAPVPVGAGDSGAGLRSNMTRRGFAARGYTVGNATTFGFHDPIDSGIGRWGDNTNNANLAGVALPREVLARLFGPGGAGDKNWQGRLVEVVNQLTGKVARLPVVDIGPGKVPLSRGVVIDLTEGAKRLLGANGLTPIAYRSAGTETTPAASTGIPGVVGGRSARLYTRTQYEAAIHAPDPTKTARKAARTNQEIADEMIGVGGGQYEKDVSAAVKAFRAKIAAHGDYGKAMAEMNARLAVAKQRDDDRFDKALTKLIEKGAKERDAINKAAAEKEKQYARDVFAAWQATQTARWGAAMEAQKDVTEGEFGPGFSKKEREALTREMQESMARQHVEQFGEQPYGPGFTFEERQRQNKEMQESAAKQHSLLFGSEEYGPSLSEKTKTKQANESARAFKETWGSTMKTVEGGFEHFATAAFKHVHSVGSLWQEFVKSMREVFINAIAQMAARWATASIFGGNKGPLGTLGGSSGGGGGLFGGLGSVLGGIGSLFGGGHKGADVAGPVKPGGSGGGAAGGLASLLHLGGGLGAALPLVGGGLVLNQLMGNPLAKLFKGVKKLFHFDDPINDRAAQKWGFDFASHFAKGAEGSWDRRAAFGQESGKGAGNTSIGGHTVNVHLHGNIHGVEDVHQTFKDAAQHVHSQLAVVTPL